MTAFPLVFADSERDVLEIETRPLGSHTGSLTNKLQEIKHKVGPEILGTQIRTAS
jgi:hypothetical protein